LIIARLVTAPLGTIEAIFILPPSFTFNPSFTQIIETIGVIQQTGVAQLEAGTVKTFKSLIEREGWLALFKGESLVALRTAHVLLTPILSYIANVLNFGTHTNNSKI